MATANPTPITPPRVPFLDERTGLISREWYMFFLGLFSTAQSAVNSDGLGPSAGSLAASLEQALEQLRQAALTQPNTATQLEQALDQLRQATLTQPLVSYTKEIDDLRQEVRLLPRVELGTMAALQQSNVPWITFDSTPNGTPTTVGTLAWDGGTTLGLQATAGVLMQLGESEYSYVKASSAITKGQVCYHTGSVGSSGVITAAPTPLALTDPNQIVGLAAEDIALNAFGLIQVSGTLRGFNTTGTAVGETWADGDPLYYNPAYVGALTKTKPSAPNQKTYIGEVINAGSGGSGSVSIRIVPGSVLGGTDSNVQFSSLANGDMIQYDGTAQYWRNRAVLADSILYTASTKALSTSSSFKYDGTNMSVGGGLNASYRLNVVGGGISWGNDTTVRGANTYDVSGIYVGSVTNTPLVFNVNGTERAKIDTSGNFNIAGLTASRGVFTDASKNLTSTGTLGVNQGGTGLASWTANGIVYASGTTTLTNGANLQYDGTNMSVGGALSASYRINVVGGGVGWGDGSTITGAATYDVTNVYLGSVTNHALVFNQNNTECMRINTSGRVRITNNAGVGSSATATTRLYVRGADATSSNSALYLDNSTPAALFYVRNDGLINTGLEALSPYNNTTGNAANVNLDTNGNLLRSTSSLRYKTDVQDAKHGLAEVLQLRSVTFKGKNDGDTIFGGLIAEEVHAAGLTEFVVYDDNGQPDALHYGNMVGLLVKAVQEQQALITDLKARVAALESR